MSESPSNTPNRARWCELIDLHLLGTISTDEAIELEGALASSRAAREDYRLHCNVDTALSQEAAVQPMTTARPTPKPARWLTWRPLTAAAAGIVFGMFCTSVVFGFVAQRHFSVQTLLTESFEDVQMVRDRGVPSRVGVWSGDLEMPHGEAGDIKPAEGLHMVTLPVVDKRRFSYAFRFVDVTSLPPMSAGQTREIEVTARFHGAATGARNRFQIRLAAFAEDAAATRAIWVTDHVDEQALGHVAKMVKTDPEDRGWTTARAVIDVLAEAKVVLVSLAAAAADADPKSSHYLDDVQIRLITRDEALP